MEKHLPNPFLFQHPPLENGARLVEFRELGPQAQCPLPIQRGSIGPIRLPFNEPMNQNSSLKIASQSSFSLLCVKMNSDNAVYKNNPQMFAVVTEHSVQCAVYNQG